MLEIHPVYPTYFGVTIENGSPNNTDEQQQENSLSYSKTG
jgi:hypothetical protein